MMYVLPDMEVTPPPVPEPTPADGNTFCSTSVSPAPVPASTLPDGAKVKPGVPFTGKSAVAKALPRSSIEPDTAV
ncbi:hypothetical protein D3C71_2057880 [compost metagenome]